MDEETKIGLALILFVGIALLLFTGAVKGRRGGSFWATRLLFGGAFLILISSILISLVIISLRSGNQPGSTPIGFLIVVYFSFLSGCLLYLIGFFGFCLRWGATGKRRTELLEITAALTAARDQAQRNASLADPAS